MDVALRAVPHVSSDHPHHAVRGGEEEDRRPDAVPGRHCQGRASLKARPIRTMLNHHTNEVFIDNLEVSDDDRIGEEGRGFHYLVESLNSNACW